MKRLSIILMFLASIISALSQNPNKVYSIDKEVPNKDLPQKRTLYGGTIINVKYIGSGFSKTVQGAFEYACKLIEEDYKRQRFYRVERYPFWLLCNCYI